MNESSKELVDSWHRRIREAQISHHASGTYFDSKNSLLAIPTIVITTAVGTAVFASISLEVSVTAKVTTGLFSLLAAVLSALYAFLGLSERAERHRQVSASYGALKRKVEELAAFPPNNETSLKAQLETVRREADLLAASAPHVPYNVRKKALETTPLNRPDYITTESKGGTNL